ncbi:MAG: YbjN domain-containing protein [Bacteroidales bacterium]|jgi:hypothetical protein|nr:YbjN domain-containing protein [Bacteroidales bacterium]
MKNTLTFTRSILASTASKIDVDSFDKSIEAFEKKEFLDSFYLLLNYINPTFKSQYGNAEGTEFNVPHGSIVVNIKIEDNQLRISAPFISLPTKGKIPLLRHVAVINFSHLNLAQIVLRDEKLYFEYVCPMDLIEPYKIYYVLEDICFVGDKYDDEFVTKFGAERIYQPKITPYETTLVDTIYDEIQLSCNECMEAIKEFESQRKYGYEWNIISFTILKMLYYAHPQGQLLNDLNKAVRELDRDDIPLSDINEVGKKMVERLQSMSKEELAANLYFTETFIPPKRRSVLKNVQENFNEAFEKAGKDFASNDYMTCCVRLIYEFYRLYHYNNVQDDINAVVVNAMGKSSAKPWEEAAKILLPAMEKIMEGELTLDDVEESADNETDDSSAQNAMAEYMKAMQQTMGNVNMEELAKNMQEAMNAMIGNNNQSKK